MRWFGKPTLSDQETPSVEPLPDTRSGFVQLAPHQALANRVPTAVWRDGAGARRSRLWI